MAKPTPTEQNGWSGPAAYGAAYHGPHRRSTDLPELREGGLHSVRLRVINLLLTAVTIVLMIALFVTIEGKQALLEATAGQLPREVYEQYGRSIDLQLLLTGLLILVVVLTIGSVMLLVLRPMREFLVRIGSNRMLPMRGSYEMQYFARAYNIMFEENMRRNEELRYKVEHDALTGLYNRGAYEKLLAEHGREDSIALLWIDVDRFKGINDTYGHDVGDKVLQKVARLLAGDFRASDYACRTGGDEFAVIMTDVTPDQQQVVMSRVEAVQEGLRDVSDGLPLVTLSIGVAFSEQRQEGEELFKMADKALYRVKEAGRNGCAIFSEADRSRATE
ncbi:MAG: GGDEF domain-containing protein [Oscillospiraceae bacterium]|nr:GGDEF domain-containing protein [Oscillospiraceae bacterium]